MKFKLILIFLALIITTNVVYAQGSNFDTAVTISTGLDYEYYITDGKEHYFKVYIDSGQEVTVTLDIEDNSNDFDLLVYDPSQTMIGASASIDEDEQVTFTADETGYYYIEIYACSGSGYYTLRVDIGGSGGGSSGGGGGAGGHTEGGEGSGTNPFDLINQITQQLQNALNPIADFFNNIAQAFNNFANSVQNMFNSVTTAIQNAFNAVANGINSLIQGVWDTINGIINGITTTVQNFVTAIANGLNSIATSLQNFGNYISQGITTVINGIVGVVTNAVGWVWSGIQALATGITSAASGIITAIQNGFSGIGIQLGSISEQLQDNALLIIAIILIVVGIFAFQPALYLGVILLGFWGLQQLQIVQNLMNDPKSLAFIILGIAGLALLLKR